MGWLFGKKKEPKVPFPKGQEVGSDISRDTLHFSAPSSRDRIIQPEKVKAAVGKPAAPMPAPVTLQPVRVVPKQAPKETVLGGHEGEPLFIKMDVYQQIIDNLADLHGEINKFKSIAKKIDESEFNEETQFSKLRRAMKSTHDNLLQVDEKLFNIGR